MAKTKETFDEAVAEARRGMGVSLEEILIAALVAAPFSGTFAVWLHQLLPLPNVLMWLVWLAVEAAATLWIAGRRRRELDRES